ncbi:MAG TPA: NifU family protein [Solirubrobacterales bacterium]|nr:NifU family protein [Solirubrobacterales bacterium]
MSADDQSSGESMLAITDAAYDKVMGFLLREAEPERQAMWLEVSGTSANQWTCRLALKPLDAAAPYDAVIRHRDLAIVVPECDFDKVRGATIDWLDDPFGGGGLRVDNPNTPSPAIGVPPPADLSGDVAQRVIQVLDQQVNPSIAAHGGRAELVAVEQGTAYLRLGGGCQGCAMATVTLSQGIEAAIIQAVPEITSVVDVTDHQSGTNPYFEAAKK